MNILESIDLARTAVWAYLDPGTGSMVLQVVMAGLLGSALFVKTWIRQVRDAIAPAIRARKS